MPKVAPPTLFWLAGGLLVGQGAALRVSGAAWEWVVLAGALLLVGAARLRPHLRPLTLLALAAAAAAGGHRQLDARLRPDWPAGHVGQAAPGRLFVRGRIAARPVRRPGATRLLVEVEALRRGAEWRAASGRVRVTVREVTHPWRRGDALTALLALRRPRNFGNLGEFDYEAYLARRGVYATASATTDATWQRTAAGGDGWVDRWRTEVTHTIERTLPAGVAPIVGALLVGDAIPVPGELRDRYARAGVAHVLSISGLHVGLVAAAAFAVWRWLLARSERALLYGNVPKLAAALSAMPVALYGAIAGDNVATIRAEIMGALVIAAVLLDRPRDWPAGLAAAAAAISLTAPGALAEISFQLSFVAVIAILAGMRRLTPRWRAWEEAHLVRLRGRHWQWVRWLVLTEAATLCASAGTAPLTAWHFNQVSLIGLVANPLIVPLLGGVAVGLGLLATAAVAVLPAVAPGLFMIVGTVAWVADGLVRLCAAVPGASVYVATPTAVELAAMYGSLAALLLPPGRWRRCALVACALVLAASVIGWQIARRAAGDLRVTFVSVGQGDCTVVEFPRGPVMVVDGGGLPGSFDVGRHVVAPFLWRRKITRIDLLVLTHPDYDHYGGLEFLVRAFAPRELWWTGRADGGPRFAALRRAWEETAVAIREVARGTQRVVNGVEIRVLHPARGAAGDDNDHSLTLQLRHGAATVLLPGDLEAAGERALVGAAGSALRSTVLKVPHHGSRTSSSAPLLDAVAPRLAVVSAGIDNRFGFPHPAVIAAYAARDATLLRTDRDGAVAVRLAADGALALVTGTGPCRAGCSLDRLSEQSLNARRH